ncbi:hypothetical protein ACQW02_21880 [Humitalea sp. 24SJ18S-53]|uniref:hypothetical protein n=1 Tax=Humitalea sp. 24SJ18S-53 TaxID=3422307 RepID=UPI003D6703E8
MKRYDAAGVLVVVAAYGLMALYRALGVEPAAFSACAQQPRMLACEPRAVLLWLQHWQVFGGAALVLGLWALRGAPFPVRVAAVAMGAVAVVNFNMTWGVAGAALGAWVWLSEGSSPAPIRAM